MNDLGLEYVTDTSNYDALRVQIYEYYGAAGILSTPRIDYDFPEPLWSTAAIANTFENHEDEPQIASHSGRFEAKFEWSGNDICYTGHHSDNNLQPPAGKEQFFKHLMHPEAKALLSVVNTVLAAEHKNSPIFAASTNLDIDRESIAQIVDRAYHLTRAAGITPCTQTKALLNMLVLSELLVWQ